jgi:hypothetical protein
MLGDSTLPELWRGAATVALGHHLSSATTSWENGPSIAQHVFRFLLRQAHFSL